MANMKLYHDIIKNAATKDTYRFSFFLILAVK